MGRRKNENIRKLQRTGGGTYVISLPIRAVRLLKWQENQKLVVEFDKRKKDLLLKTGRSNIYDKN